MPTPIPSTPTPQTSSAFQSNPAPAMATYVPVPVDIHIESADGWEAWTHNPDYSYLYPGWEQVLAVRSPRGEPSHIWRLSDDVRHKYYLPIAWAPGMHLLLAGRAANCNSCWSWGVPLATINAETGQIAEMEAAMLLTPEAYAFSPTRPGLVAISQGGSRFLLDGMRLALLDLNTGKRRDLTDPTMTAFEPTWSPDGKLIAYAVVHAAPHATIDDAVAAERLLNGRAIYIMNPDSGENHALTQPGEQHMDGYPRWAPDGNHLTYARRYADRTEERRISLDGKTDELIATYSVSPTCNYAGCDWADKLRAASGTPAAQPSPKP